ncbi:MAG TPA: T9SS type A sorting domain-containing protein [Cyclobacteriaceae bacterium]
MKKTLLLLFIGLLFTDLVFAQQITLRVPIVKTETVTEEDDGVTITFDASSDDAEQENDEIDALFDDDIDAGWEGEPEDQNILTAGLRFQNITIPRGAVIESAIIEVWSHESKTTEDVAALTIYAEKTANASTFTEDALITDRTPTDAQIEWTVDEEWGLWTRHETPDLKSIIQEIVDMDDWQSSNSIAFIIAGEDQGPSEAENAREWESFENIADPEDGGDGQNHPERVPALVITYTTADAGLLNIPIVQTELVTEFVEDDNDVVIDTITFAASSDDAEQENDEIDALFDDDIDAGWEGEPEDQNILTAGLRFQNIGIPQGATIDSVFIEVVSHEAKTTADVANLTIYAEDTDNSQTFTEDALFTDRTSTDARVQWIVDEEWGLWTTHRTPDLKDIVQEVVDRGGWSPGNSIAFIFAGEDQGPSEVENAREWESFENIADPEDGGDGQNHPERIPRLIVYYGGFTDDGGEGMVTSVEIPVEPVTRMYPNPATTYFNIELKKADDAILSVLNLNGVLISQFSNNGHRNLKINTSSFKQGLYIINIKQSGQSFNTRLIIK